MNQRKFNDLEIDILAFLLKNGEQRFIQIAEALFPQHAKNFNQDENHFKVVLVRTLDGLRSDDGYVEKKIKSPRNVCYNIPEQKRAEVEKIVKRYRNLKEIEALSDEEIEELLEENKKRALLRMIEEEFLPFEAVVEKLQQLGFDMTKEENLSKLSSFSVDALPNVTPDDIELKLIPVSKFEKLKDFFGDPPVFHNISEIPYPLLEKYIPIETLRCWKLLTPEPLQGYYIIGAFKVAIKLEKEIYEKDKWWNNLPQSLYEKFFMENQRKKSEGQRQKPFFALIIKKIEDVIEP